MIKKNVEILGAKKDFLTALTRDSGGIYKYIQSTNITEFSDKYSNFIEYLKSSVVDNVIAVTSIENYSLLQGEQQTYKEEFKSGNNPYIIETVCDIPTIIFKKDSIFSFSEEFPKDKILLLSCDSKCKEVEIADNKFAVVVIN